MTTETVEKKTQQAQALLAKGKLDEATALIQSALEIDPHHNQALYTSAVIERLNKRHSHSIELLNKVISDRPEFGRAYQEIALNHVAENNPLDAGNALEQAVALDPSLLKSWEMLVPLYKKVGSDKLKLAQEQVAFLRSLPQA